MNEHSHQLPNDLIPNTIFRIGHDPNTGRRTDPGRERKYKQEQKKMWKNNRILIIYSMAPICVSREAFPPATQSWAGKWGGI